MKLVVITAGTSIPSSTRLLGERLSEATAAELDRAGTPAEVVHLELRTLAGELANHLATRVPGSNLAAAFAEVDAAAAVIVVTPVFNGSYSGLFKMFFDALEETVLHSKPVLLAATGGTARHSLVIEHSLLPLFFYLKAVVAPHSVFAATKDWGATKLDRRIQRAAAAFAELIRRTPATKAPDEVVDFTDLLGL